MSTKEQTDTPNYNRIDRDEAHYVHLAGGQYIGFISKQLGYELIDELTALKSMIAKSSLIEVETTTVESRGGHPVIVKDGTMLVHKDDTARVQQRTKDLQQLAAKSRQIAALLSSVRKLVGEWREWERQCAENAEGRVGAVIEKIQGATFKWVADDLEYLIAQHPEVKP